MHAAGRTHPAAVMGERAIRAFVFALFFTSGFAALLYQVIWQRVLAVFSGADVYSVTIIVAVFMAGLGCGSLVGGYVADRVSVGRRILLFALAELAVAGFAFGSLWLYYDVLYQRLGHLAGSPLVLALVLFASLLWPTFFMGMSLPLLARTLTRRVDGAAATVGSLYGFNTFGAAVGAFLTTWVFMRTLGFEHTVQLGAALNVLAAIGSLAVAPYFLRGGEPDPPAGTDAATTDARDAAVQRTRFPVPVWIAIYGLSGFVALSLEIVWFRVLGVMLKSTAFTFGTLLSIFLLGLTAGTFGGLRWAARSRRPALVFLALQTGISAHAGLSLLLLSASLERVPLLAPLWEYLGSYEPLDVSAALLTIGGYLFGAAPATEAAAYQVRVLVVLYVAVPLLITGPATVMMGLSFPFLQRVVQRDIAMLGRRVGWLQTANILGSMLGAGLTGWALLHVLGTAGTLRLLVLCGAVFGVLLMYARGDGGAHARPRSVGVATAGAFAALCAVAWLLPGSATLWARLHGTTPDHVIVAEDGSGLSVLKSGASGFAETVVYANGLGQSAIPFPTHHITLGLVPVMLHPAPREVAIIGLGSGATLYAASGRAETTRITAIEIVAPQLRTLRQLDARIDDDALAALLADPRIRYTFGDARAVIRLRGRKYDVIEADALRPTSAYAGNLFSLEYFALLREHLNTGGIAVSWAPTDRVVDTFVRAFPHVMLFEPLGIRLLVGSNEPLTWDGAAVSARLTSAFSSAHYRRAGVDVRRYVEAFATPPTFFPAAHDRARLTDVNTDLFPRDEFLVPRAGGS